MHCNVTVSIHFPPLGMDPEAVAVPLLYLCLCNALFYIKFIFFITYSILMVSEKHNNDPTKWYQSQVAEKIENHRANRGKYSLLLCPLPTSNDLISSI